MKKMLVITWKYHFWRRNLFKWKHNTRVQNTPVIQRNSGTK